MRSLQRFGSSRLGATRASLMLGVVGAVLVGAALWRALARDLEARRAGLGFGGPEEGHGMQDHRGTDLPRQLASERATAPVSDDLLSPGNVLREHALESRTERLGDGTPTGPLTSPPVDPDKT